MSDVMTGLSINGDRPKTRNPRSMPSQLDAPARPERSVTMDLFLCELCDEKIGVYEPLVVCAPDGASITTSRAAEPDLQVTAGDYYHRDCFAAWEGDQEHAREAASQR